MSSWPPSCWVIRSWCWESSSVVIRGVRRVSLWSSEAELCSCDPAVHVSDVLTFSLTVVYCIIWAGHKYLVKTEQRGEICHQQGTHHISPHLIILHINLLITWLFIPSSLGTSILLTLTNLDSRWWQEMTSIKCCLKCTFTDTQPWEIKMKDLKAPLTFAWWAREAPGRAELLSLGFLFLQPCSLWRCTSRLRPHCGHRTLQICKCLHGQNRKSFHKIKFKQNNLFTKNLWTAALIYVNTWFICHGLYQISCWVAFEGWWFDRSWPRGCF